MKKPLIAFLLFSAFFVNGQSIDSLYNQFLRVKGIKQLGLPNQVSDAGEPIKCGFGTINNVRMNYDKFSATQKKVVAALLGRPASDTSVVTKSGKIRIHFFKSGVNAPVYDINELVKAADSVYNYEVNILGFPPPPGDFGLGGDDLYDIYIENLGYGNYGYTDGDQKLTDSTYACYSAIDNDFEQGFNTHGINAAKVTLAHEFHHAIQMGNYIYRPNDLWYMELTSTSMEEFVFDSVNDYYFYLPTYFRYPHKSLGNLTIDMGYSRVIWNIYLKERFGVGIIKQIWDLIPKERALKAFADVIVKYGSDFKTEFNQFGTWMYYTNFRAVPNKYFKEAASYPLIKYLMSTQFTPPSTLLSVSSEPVSNNFLVFKDNSTTPGDTLVSILSNCNIDGAISSPIKYLDFNYTVSTQKISDRNILNKYYTKYESSNNFILIESNILDNIPIEGFSTAELDYPFPQPFRYSVNPEISFPTKINGTGKAELYIYSAGMKLVYSGAMQIRASDKIYITWNAIDNQNKKLSSGVYIYFVKSGDVINKGKFVIYND